MSRAVVSLPARDLALSRFRVGRRSVSAVGLVAVAGVAIALVFALRPSPGPGVPRPLGASKRVGELSVSVPRGFYVYTVGGDLTGMRTPVRTPVLGYVLTDFRLPAGTTLLTQLNEWAQWSGSGPPSNAVVLGLEKDGRMVPTDGARLHLPLSVKQSWYQAHSSNGRTDAFRVGRLDTAVYSYLVSYWVGPAAPANDRVALLQTLSSIRVTR